MSFSPDLLALSAYAIKDPARVVTPALLIYPDKVHSNIKTTLGMLGGDANRWRPHIKTAKLAAVIKGYIRDGVRQFKCSTTLELLIACQSGAEDVLVAFSMVGANALRVKQIASAYPNVRVSVLVEAAVQAQLWKDGSVGVFLDLNSGMNRTGMEAQDVAEMIRLAQLLGDNFRGLHWYDGHVNAADVQERKRQAFAGYDRLMQIIAGFQRTSVVIQEVITSGTPAAPFGYQYEGFRSTGFVHRISPGTVVYNDLSSLKQLPDYGYVPAALVMATVVSHPKTGVITCDAGHKAVAVDSGVPNCAVIGHPELTPLKPSEEHLPLEVGAGLAIPAIGEKLYLLPRHVCPTVNNFDKALIVDAGNIVAVEAVNARGHECPLLA